MRKETNMVVTRRITLQNWLDMTSHGKPSIEGLHDAVRTYTRTILPCPRDFLFCIVRYWEKQNNKTTFYFWIPSSQKLKFQPRVCTVILVTLCNFGIVVWTQLKVSGRFLSSVFLYRTMRRGNQHGVRKCDDLQNRLDMTSHENSLLYENNARALLSRILSIANSDWLHHARSVRGCMKQLLNTENPWFEWFCINVNPCNVSYLYLDIEDPTIISCPANQTKDTAPGLSTAVAVWADLQATDNTGVTPTVTYSLESGSQFEIGQTEVICEARDPSGNKAFCSFTIDVTGK